MAPNIITKALHLKEKCLAVLVSDVDCVSASFNIKKAQHVLMNT